MKSFKKFYGSRECTIEKRTRDIQVTFQYSKTATKTMETPDKKMSSCSYSFHINATIFLTILKKIIENFRFDYEYNLFIEPRSLTVQSRSGSRTRSQI